MLNIDDLDSALVTRVRSVLTYMKGEDPAVRKAVEDLLDDIEAQSRCERRQRGDFTPEYDALASAVTDVRSAGAMLEHLGGELHSTASMMRRNGFDGKDTADLRLRAAGLDIIIGSLAATRATIGDLATAFDSVLNADLGKAA